MSNTIVTELAKEIYNQSCVIDLQLGFEPEIEAPYKWDVVNRFAASGFSMISMAVATDATSLEKTIEFIAGVREKISIDSDKYILAKSVQDIEKAKAENKLAVNFLLQGPNPLSKNLSMLDVYYQLGVRSLILAYNIRNPFADGCIEPYDAGLSRLGKKLIQKMNDIGMLIDCAHTGYNSSLEAIALSQAPVIFSHSNVYALHAHPRNLKDEQIKAVAQSGGVIGINGNAALLGVEQATPEKFVENIDYISQLVGAEFVSLGTDWVYFPELFENYMSRQAIFYSSSYTKGIEAKKLTAIEPEQVIEIVELLLQRGYTRHNIQGILGENYLKVVRQVWK
jgi:membrane dipeptidase